MCSCCILLYLVSKKYIGGVGALIAGVLAGTWTATNNAVFWTAAVFDVLSALFCLASIWIWQLGWNRKYPLIYFIGGAFVYFLAIRTKEFAIGLPVILFLISLMLEKRSLAETVSSLLPYWLVMAVLGAAYLHLFHLGVSLTEPGSNPYAFHFSSIANTLIFYFSRTFYVQQLGVLGPMLAAGMLLTAAVWNPGVGRLVIVGLGGFLVLLGPTLLLGAHQDALYLYAPHFFLAFAIGSLFTLPFFWKCVVLAASGVLIIAPPTVLGFSYLTNLFSMKTADYSEQFHSFLRAIGNVQRGSTIFIAGLENYMNPFSYGPGNSVKVAMKERSLKFVIEKPREVLLKEYCATGSPKYFIAFHGNAARNETALASRSCDQAVSGTSEQ